MPRNQLNIRLDPQMHEVLKAIAEAIGDDPKLPPSDVTSLVKKALKVYIEEFRKDPKYRPAVEGAESASAEREREGGKQPKLVSIPGKRKPPSSVVASLGREKSRREGSNE